MSILFLTGATVTFKSLLDHIATPKFLEYLVDQGFHRVSIQYGNETNLAGHHISKEYFNLLLQRNKVIEELDLSIANETNDKSTTVFANSNLELQVFAYSDKITQLIAQADLVVSHGGTGSIMDALRLAKPLLVVTNDQLMDNHQIEVAEQFEQEGYLKSLSCVELSTGVLEKSISDFKSKKLVFNVLDSPPEGVLLGIIEELVEKDVN